MIPLGLGCKMFENFHHPKLHRPYCFFGHDDLRIEIKHASFQDRKLVPNARYFCNLHDKQLHFLQNPEETGLSLYDMGQLGDCML